MLNEIISTLIFCFAIYLLWSWVKKTPKNFPPGTDGFPIFGSAPFLGKNPERVLAKWGWEEYGPLFYFTQGGIRTVVLNTLESAQEGLMRKGNTLSGRFGVKRSCGVHDLSVFNDFTPEWKDQRKMRISTLKNFGKLDLDDVILKQTNHACDEITRACKFDQSKGFEAGYILALPTFNVITCVIYGRCLDNEAGTREAIKVLVDSIYREKVGPSLTSVLSFCTDLFLGKRENANQSDSIKRVRVVTDRVQSRKGFLDGFVNKMSDGADDYYNCDQLSQYLVDLFVAGTDSMATAVHWVLVFLAANQKQQAIIHDEIDHVLGKDGDPDMTHHDVMPQTVAAIYEVYRMRPVFPLSISHQATDDVTIMGHFIPKNTKVTANLWAIQNDPKHWKSPEKFKPKRHINKEGKFVKSDKIIPFSIGPRFCLGSQLATCHNFIFVVRLLQRFSFHYPANQPHPDLGGTTSFVLAPTGVKLIAKSR